MALPMSIVTIKEAAHVDFIVSLQIQRGEKLGKQPFKENAGVPIGKNENISIPLNTVACVVLILLKVLWSEITAQNSIL